MNIKEVSEKLNVNAHTIRKWEKDFQLQIKRDNQNNRIYSEDNFNLIEKIKVSRDQGLSIDEIRKDLNIDIGYIEPEQVQSNNDNNSSILLLSKIDILENSIISKFDNVLTLAQEHSKATYKIGYLESENKALMQDNLRLSNHSIEDISRLNQEILALKNDKQQRDNIIIEKDSEIEKLKNEIRDLKNKTLWDFLRKK